MITQYAIDEAEHIARRNARIEFAIKFFVLLYAVVSAIYIGFTIGNGILHLQSVGSDAHTQAKMASIEKGRGI